MLSPLHQTLLSARWQLRNSKQPLCGCNRMDGKRTHLGLKWQINNIFGWLSINVLFYAWKLGGGEHVDCLESHLMSDWNGQLVNSHWIVLSNEDNSRVSIILTMLINKSVTGLQSSNSWLDGMEEEERSKRDSKCDSAMRQSFQKTFFSICCGQQFPLKQYIKISEFFSFFRLP